MPAKKSKAESKTKEVKAKKPAAPAAKKSPKTATKSPAKAKAAPVKVAKPAAPAPAPVITQDQIATRAYYIGERRQTMGWPGDPSTDWIEAEAQLIAEAKRKKI
jgi:hypothetical protein